MEEVTKPGSFKKKLVELQLGTASQNWSLTRIALVPRSSPETRENTMLAILKHLQKRQFRCLGCKLKLHRNNLRGTQKFLPIILSTVALKMGRNWS